MAVCMFDGNTEIRRVLFRIFGAELVSGGREVRVCWGLVSVDQRRGYGHSILLFLAIGHCVLWMLVKQM